MRERMARALNSLAYAPHEESWAKDKWPVFLPHVDAVLAAMHEPTEAMVEAYVSDAHGKTIGDVATAGWRAMVAAALEEKI